MAPYCFLGYWCIAGKITGFCALAGNKGLKRDFIMHKSLQIYIERTFCKTQSVHLGANRRNHRFFVGLVALIFRLTVGSFACLDAVDFSLIVDTRIAQSYTPLT